ncbi:MAG: UDP-N-acetyl-D-glucosamine dehydrogenase, partial [Candidatus Omnitrophica bacterium]|nr:UDP-N-acetyl-D-glucosamine dehydrogenase [Candidatus Omnitrophota bacterium]
MNYFKQLKKKINERQAKICIIGLGYVGMPLAVNLAKKNFFVYGYDNNCSRVKRLKTGKNYIGDIGAEEVSRLIDKDKFLPTTDRGV